MSTNAILRNKCDEQSMVAQKSKKNSETKIQKNTVTEDPIMMVTEKISDVIMISDATMISTPTEKAVQISNAEWTISVAEADLREEVARLAILGVRRRVGAIQDLSIEDLRGFWVMKWTK